MTNFEKYRKQLLEFIVNNKGSSPAMVDGKFVKCGDTHCSKCSLDKEEYHGMYCRNRMLLWLCEEYQEPTADWSKVEVDTKVLVSDDGEEWHKRHFARYEEGIVYVWGYGDTSWTTDLMEAWEYAKLAEVE